MSLLFPLTWHLSAKRAVNRGGLGSERSPKEQTKAESAGRELCVPLGGARPAATSDGKLRDLGAVLQISITNPCWAPSFLPDKSENHNAKTTNPCWAPVFCLQNTNHKATDVKARGSFLGSGCDRFKSMPLLLGCEPLRLNTKGGPC